MMVRKQVKPVDEKPSRALPYPVSPVAPQGPDTETADCASHSSATLPTGGAQVQDDRDPISGQIASNVWADLGSLNAVNEFPNTPAAVERRNGRMGIVGRDNSLPPSLRVGLPVLTPRSSIDSQRSTDSVTKLSGPTNPIQHTQASYPQNLSSNNPWASVASSPPQNIKAPASSAKTDSLLDSEPFAEPWFDFPASPLQHIPANPDLAIPPLDKEGTYPFDIYKIPTGVQCPNGTENPPAISLETPSQLRPAALNPDLATQALNTEQNPFGLYEDPQEGGQGLNGAYKTSNTSLETGNGMAYDGPERQELEGTSPWGTSDMQKALPELPLRGVDLPPELPPRISMDSEDVPPPKPARPSMERLLAPSKNPQLLEGSNHQSSEAISRTERCTQNFLAPERTISAGLSTGTRYMAEKQRNETYQIRLINWLDASSSGHIRSSPVMVQNANGPCPLLALVNALTLSTPAHISTALVDTLRVREQLSLGLLLDAVIDELMSDRRGDAAHSLPDVSDLYTFLVNLHTGMNVNPSFVSSEEIETSLIDAPIFETPSNPSQFQEPGGFEGTRELKLYGTFGIALIHGWIPPRNHPTFAALKRSAKTYEEAQNLMFREEELEDKLHQHGLNEDEQLMLEDISSIKYFLSSSATQLTEYGLETITRSLRSGSIAILFRNDHFTTLYKHPHSGQLFTLVTDMGYAGHDEVVWESLADVSGEGCEFFAGDFRPVGHGCGPSPSKPSGDSGWTTVSRSNGNNSGPHRPTQSNNQLSSGPLQSSFSRLSLDEATPKSPSTEQEDHDLALALQLQEEEEDLHRREAAARHREEDELSQAFLASQSPTTSSNRRGGGAAGRGRSRGQEVRPLVPPRGGVAIAAHKPRKAPDDGEDAPPPTYEQAANGPAYHPPPDHPVHPTTHNASTPTRPQRSQSAYYQNNATLGGGAPNHDHRGSSANSPIVGNDGSRRRGSATRHTGPTGRGRAGSRAAVVNAEDADRRDCLVM